MNENKNALVLVEQGRTDQMMSVVTGTCFRLYVIQGTYLFQLLDYY